MSFCEVCGNEYDRAFQVHIGGRVHTFDCFECAIQALAPQCSLCGCRVIGHGCEVDGDVYCSAHCAKTAGHRGVRDRIDRPTVITF
ncbi:MAG TPA: hypothetical protein VNI20_14145 [Fimbriimonadaceae bacterium]|nr:hypothetical protein [Fimbriimonadaceae bacterium]